MKQTIILLLLSIIIMSNSCEKKEEAFLTKTPYKGNEIRLNGYYFYTYKDYENIEYFSPIFLYRDGIALQETGNEISKQEEMERDYYNSSNSRELNLKTKWVWEVFLVNNNEIIFESWNPEDIYAIRRSIGKILNDTTIVLYQKYRIVNGIQTRINMDSTFYYFKKFSPKPDSTNSFVK